MTNQSDWIRSIPVISTCHLPSPTALKDISPDLGLRVADYEEGAFVFIGTPGEMERAALPGWLSAICEWAWREHGAACAWISFDRDGSEMEGLASYSW